MDESTGLIDFGTDECALAFELESGTFAIEARGVKLLEGARGRILVYRDGKIEELAAGGGWMVEEKEPSKLRLVRRETWGRSLYRVELLDGALSLEMGMAWEEDGEPPAVEAVVPLSVPPGGIWPGRSRTRSWRFYSNGWQCWSPSGVLKRARPGDYLYPLFMPRRLKAMLANTATPVSSEKGNFTSEWFAGLADLDAEDSVVIGFTGISRALSVVTARLGRRQEESALEAVSKFEGKRPAGGDEFYSEPLVVIPGDLSGWNLEAYAEEAARRHGARAARGAPVGWSSWYHYFTKVTAGDVEKNLELVAGRYRGLGIELVQVDDGYQREPGEWLTTNRDFPGGLAELARGISSRGKVPGIWVAPFTVTRRSEIFKKKKEWLARDGKGRPVLAGVNPLWKGRFYGLDVTHPEVLEWLRETFGSLVELGFRFIKLDFLACGLLEGKRHDPSLTRAEAARRALEVIRGAVGDDTYLLAAGGPVMLGVGIIDAQRVGGDVAPCWRPFWQPFLRDRATPGARNCLINVFTRCFMSGRLWRGDPDCMLVRGSETKLGPTERRTLASGISVFGGSLMFSDDLDLWGPEGEELASRILPPVEARPACPDLWRNEVPGLMVSRLVDPGGEYYLVWAVNWSRFSRDIELTLGGLGVEPGRYHACEFWSCAYLGEVVDSLEVRGVEGHGSAVVRLTPAGAGPRLVGSNLHVCQGAAELERMEVSPGGIELSVSCPLESRAVLAIYFPGGGVLRAARDKDVSVERVAGQVYRIEFDLEGRRDVSLAADGS